MKAVLAILLLVLPLQAQSDPGAAVRQFYDWYIPTALANREGPAWRLALLQRGSVFNTALRKALQDDTDAQTKARGVIVGLDFDPFLHTQDPCDAYEVGRVFAVKKAMRVEIRAVCGGGKRALPDATVELAEQKKQWVFVNIYYSDGGDLLAVLRALRESRKRGRK